QQPDRHQGPPAPDGLPAALRESATSAGPNPSHPGRTGGGAGEAGRVSGSVRYALEICLRLRCPLGPVGAISWPLAYTLRCLLAQDRTDMVTHSARRRRAAQVRGVYRAALHMRLQGLEQACGGFGLAEKIEHHLPGPDGGQRVSNAPAFDIWS